MSKVPLPLLLDRTRLGEYGHAVVGAFYTLHMWGPSHQVMGLLMEKKIQYFK